MEVDVRLIEQLCLNEVSLFYRLLVAEWKRKSEVGDLVLRVGEVVLKLEEEHLHFCFLV